MENMSAKKDIFELLQDNEKELNDQIRANFKSKETKLDKWYLKILLLLLTTSFIMVAIAKLFESQIVMLIAFLILLFGYLWQFFYPCFLIYKSKDSIVYFMRYPFSASIQLTVLSKINFDRQLLEELAKHDAFECNLVLLELKHERAGLEDRQNLLLGVVKKIGIVPGLIANLLGLLNISENLNMLGTLIFAFSLGNIILQLYPIFIYRTISYYDRMIALLNLRLNQNS